MTDDVKTRIIEPTEDVDEMHSVDNLRFDRLDHTCVFVAGYSDNEDDPDYKMWFQCGSDGLEVKIEEH